MKNSITLTEWRNLLESEQATGIDKPGPEWMTRTQIQEEAGLKKSAAHDRINRLVQQGILESKRFRIRSGNCVTPVMHYRKKLAQPQTSGQK